jgi:hypothetical protein
MDKRTYRDYCAAMAMQAILPVSGNMRNPGATAAQAFDIADAMAAERERREQSDAAGLVSKINAGPDGR